jgi:hypothetical protein
MFEYSGDDDDHEWYSLHFLESEAPVMKHLALIHDWVLAHPSEIVVLWLSKHGDDDYDVVMMMMMIMMI